MKKISIILILIALFFSCKKENRTDCFKGNGKEVKQTRTLENIDDIDCYDKVEVNIYQSVTARIEVNAGENLLSNIKTEINGTKLTIKNNNTCNFVRGYKKKVVVNVYTPFVKYIKNNGVANINVIDFTLDTLYVRAENSGEIFVSGRFKKVATSSHGNGTIHVSGTTNQFFGYMFGTNFLYAQDLKINQYGFVENISYGDTYVNLNNTPIFECNIWRDGNIYYKGNPTILNNFYNEEGKGELIKED